MNKSLVFALVALLSVAVFATAELNQADAMKSQGTSIPKYGIATKSKVCGDRLCSETTPEQKKTQMTQTEPKQAQSQTMTQQKMQMPQLSDSMSKSEILESMTSLMNDHRNMMLQKMGQMTQQELLDHAKLMEEHFGKMGSDHMATSGMQMGMENKQMGKDKEMGMDHTQMDKSDKQMGMQMQGQKTPLYNEMLNPNQIEYPNIIGFNDLHIEAIRHLDPDGNDSKLGVIVHHHCKVYDDMTAACMLFPTGMTDQDKPYGIEYIITSEQFKELPDDEKQYWHYHLTELPRAKANFPDLTAAQLAPLQPVLDETYGKVFYFWNTDDKYPIGEPTVLVIQNLPE